MKESIKITTIYGPMFAGKSTKLIDIYNNCNSDKKLVINHSFDDRYSTNSVTTHDSVSIPCMSVKTVDYIVSLCKETNPEYLFIDEAQFFDSIDNIINLLGNSSVKQIILSGLDYDAKGNIFNKAFFNLINNSVTKFKCFSKCYKCEKNADKTILLENNIMNGNILVGGSDKYQPACSEHLNY